MTMFLPEVPGSQSRSGWKRCPNLLKGFSGVSGIHISPTFLLKSQNCGEIWGMSEYNFNQGLGQRITVRSLK